MFGDSAQRRACRPTYGGTTCSRTGRNPETPSSTGTPSIADNNNAPEEPRQLRQPRRQVRPREALQRHHDASFAACKVDVNALLAQYVHELDAVKIRASIATMLQITQRGNAFLQSSGLNYQLAENEPEKCAAVVGFAVNVVHLVAALLGPYTPDTARSIETQLGTCASEIPDHWSADTIKPGHATGKPAHLFSRIESEKALVWRKQFGGDGAEKVKVEET